MMCDTERDIAHTDRCRMMTRIGETDASLFLARYALLAIDAIGDAAIITRPIADAAGRLPDRRTAAPAAHAGT